MQKRREFLNAGAALGAATIAACAAPMRAAADRDNVLFAHDVVTIPVSGSDRHFAVRRIYCVGRNYAAHAIERGSDPTREPPFFFQKPTDAVVANNATLVYPPKTKDLQHEIELVVCIGTGGTNIPVDKALSHVFGYAVGLDMTRRDLQTEAKKMQRPWEMGKAFDQSMPVSAIQPAAKIGHPSQGAIWVKVNGQTKQTGDLNQQIWRVEEAISYLSNYGALEPGDVIMNGTPAGVGP
ncbi:MAG TPA: fumarylacetoacetate hydrolase family protein, partial [Usitatibacter sp.]|nr:fumarylacetoacetate hydrolase family protein [Usitatibacter sp.]